MTKEKMITPAEQRKIKRLWENKGDTMGLRNLKTRRTEGSFARIRLALQPAEVKDAWVKSTLMEPYPKLMDLACDVGMSDESFARWFQKAAPELMEPWLEQAKAQIDKATNTALRDFVVANTHKATHVKGTRERALDFDMLRKVLEQDRSPMVVALKAAGSGAKNIDASLAAIFDRHGISDTAEGITVTDPDFTRSIRYYLKCRREGKLLEQAAEELGLHPESLRWRLRRIHMGQPAKIDVLEEMIQLWLKGESAEAIGEALGMDRNSVGVRLTNYAPRPNEEF